MPSRPCKPGEDVKALWRMLLPDTPFPACGAADGEAAAAENGAERHPEPPATAADAAETQSD